MILLTHVLEASTNLMAGSLQCLSALALSHALEEHQGADAEVTVPTRARGRWRALCVCPEDLVLACPLGSSLATRARNCEPILRVRKALADCRTGLETATEGQPQWWVRPHPRVSEPGLRAPSCPGDCCAVPEPPRCSPPHLLRQRPLNLAQLAAVQPAGSRPSSPLPSPGVSWFSS